MGCLENVAKKRRVPKKIKQLVNKFSTRKIYFFKLQVFNFNSQSSYATRKFILLKLQLVITTHNSQLVTYHFTLITIRYLSHLHVKIFYAYFGLT